jgi:hypothetical protein
MARLSGSSGTHDQWKQRIKAQQKSGESIPAWCAREGLKVKYFYWWRKRLGLGVTLVPVRVNRSESVLPVPIAKSAELVVSIGSARLALPGGVDTKWLADLLKALQ